MLVEMMTRQRSAVPVDDSSSCRIVQLAVLDAMRELWGSERAVVRADDRHAVTIVDVLTRTRVDQSAVRVERIARHGSIVLVDDRMTRSVQSAPEVIELVAYRVHRSQLDRAAVSIVHALMPLVEQKALRIHGLTGQRPSVRIDDRPIVRIDDVAVRVDRMMSGRRADLSCSRRREDDRLTVRVRDGQVRARVAQGALDVDVVACSRLTVLVDHGTPVSVEDVACVIDWVMREMRMRVAFDRRRMIVTSDWMTVSARLSLAAAEQRGEEAARLALSIAPVVVVVVAAAAAERAALAADLVAVACKVSACSARRSDLRHLRRRSRPGQSRPRRRSHPRRRSLSRSAGNGKRLPCRHRRLCHQISAAQTRRRRTVLAKAATAHPSSDCRVSAWGNDRACSLRLLPCLSR